MEESEQSIQSLIVRYVIANMQCNGCGQRYQPEDVHVRNYRDRIWLAALTCHRCGLRALLVASVRVADSEEDVTIGECSAEEWAALQERGPISSDEVLDLHRFLARFSGDITGLFGERKRQM